MKTPPRILYCGSEDSLFKKLSRASRDLIWEAKQTNFSGSPQKFAQQKKASVLVLRIKNEFDLKHQEWLSKSDASVPVIVISQNGSVQMAIQSLQYGVFDYFCATQSGDAILRKIRDAVAQKSLRVTKRHFENANQLLLGNDPAIHQINEQVRQLAHDREPVLFMGEPGTGKEHLAYGMYQLSGIKSAPFITYDCRTLLEMSKYDGHGVPQLIHSRAQQLKRGAGPGYLFLSHAEYLGSDQLYEVLERGPGSVRLLAAYQESRPALFQEKVATSLPSIKIPSLRQRKEDIPIIADHFIRKVAQKGKVRSKDISDETLRIMQEYPWPGNIQELANTIERMMLLEPSDLLTAHTWRLSHGYNLPFHLDAANQFSILLEELLKSTEGSWRKGSLYEDFMVRMEKMLIELVLPQVQNNQAIAAKILGISRNTLRERLKM